MKDIIFDRSRSRIYDEEILELEKTLNRQIFNEWGEKLPVMSDEEEIQRIIETAEKIKEECDVLVVIGLGAIVLGSKAGLHMLHSYRKDVRAPEIMYAGWTGCGAYYDMLLKKIKGRAISVLIMAKGLLPPETELIYSHLKQEMIKKYGKEGAKDRIYVVCAGESGDLGIEAKREGYHTFTFSEEISTSYALFSAAGLLPLAVGGIDIREVIRGAMSHKEAYEKYKEEGGKDPENKMPGISKAAMDYAAVRRCLSERGKKVEVFETYEHAMSHFVEWLKHLFAGSEGKSENGIFPTSISMGNDVLDMGQFLQQGEKFFFETVINIEKPVSQCYKDKDDLHPLVNSMDQVNKAVMRGFTMAHIKAKVPVLRISVPEVSPYYFGQMVYFFMKAACLSSFLSGVDPFSHEALDIFQKELHSVGMEW